ncbi:unnamed protein product, partial [Mesorhabditis spiculigera]
MGIFGNWNNKVSLEAGVDYSLHYVTFLVRIRLKEGIGLAVRDASGSSDPYVRFKYKERIVYKSNTIFKNLNPVWDEEFSMLVDDITSPIVIEVYDYDRFCTDDFMGSAQLDLSQLKLFQPKELTLPLTSVGAPPGTCSEGEELGQIALSLSIMPQTQEEKEQFLQKSRGGVLSSQEVKAQRLVQIWSSVVNVVLVEAKGLQATAPGAPDPYCKFKLGQEKYKSKVISRTGDPKWIEQFDLHIFEGGAEMLELSCHDKRTSTCIGRTSIDLTAVERDTTVQQWHTVYSVEEEAPCGKVLLLSTDTVVDLAEFNQNDVRHAIVQKFELRYSHQCLKEVGHLTVKVFRAENLIAKDLGGKSDPFAVLELVNTRLQTHTEYKTLSPHWNKLFIFSVRDIHTCLEVTVYDEDPNNKFEFLGRVSIPLITIRNCEKKWFALKDKKLMNRVRGDILLELDLIWNPIRAAIRTFNPREQKYIQPEQKFKPAQFKAVVIELKDFAMSVIEYKDYIYSCFDWESRSRSLFAFLLFIITVYNFQLHHAPMVILLLFLKGYVYRRIADGLSHGKRWEERGLSAGGNSVDEDDEGELITPTKQKAEASSSLRDTFFSVQETLQVVQGVLVFINELLQRIKNTFNFTNPWLSWLAVVVLTVATGLLYLVPLRWIIMVWGINKFTKKLRNPHYVDNNELLDYLSRVPSDTEIQQWRELPVEPKKQAKEKTSK